MSTDSNSLNEFAVLIKTIEGLVRNLVRALVGNISLIRLQEMTERIFVEESESYLRKAQPGRDVPLTKLALLTGIDTRRLAKIRNSDSYKQPIHRVSGYLKKTNS